MKVDTIGLAGCWLKDHVPPFWIASPDHCHVIYPRGTGITGYEVRLGCHIKYIVALNEAVASVAFVYRGMSGLSFVEYVAAPLGLSSYGYPVSIPGGIEMGEHVGFVVH